LAKQDKLIEKLYKIPPPTDFKWDDFVTLMNRIGFTCEFNGNGSSHCTFYKDPLKPLLFKRPHPRKELSVGYVRKAKEYFNEIGLNLNGDQDEK